jgi:hypothetical protein
MASVAVVERVLSEAGEWRATPQQGGFYVRALSTDAVVVRWRPPAHDPDNGCAISYVEGYAQLLRQAGIPATFILDPRGPRVVCAPEHLSHEERRLLDQQATPPALPGNRQAPLASGE